MMTGLAEWRGRPPPYMVRPLGVGGEVVRRDVPLGDAEIVIKRQHHPGCRRIIGIEASLAPVPSGAGYRRGGTDFVAIAAVIDEGRHHWNESRGCSRQGGPKRRSHGYNPSPLAARQGSCCTGNTANSNNGNRLKFHRT